MKMPRFAIAPSAAASFLIAASVAHGGLVSVDFGSTGQAVFSGADPAAALLNPAFAVASVWNGLSLPFSPGTANPAFSGLVDSTGAATGVGLSFTGSLGGANPIGRSLRDYFFWNDQLGVGSASVDWTLSGLTPGARYDMVFYGANAEGDQNLSGPLPAPPPASRTFNMLVDVNGNGVLGDDFPFALQSFVDADPQPFLLTSITASASGQIAGRGSPGVGESNWAGFQIALAQAPSVPEPGTALFGFSLLGIAALRRRSARP